MKIILDLIFKYTQIITCLLDFLSQEFYQEYITDFEMFMGSMSFTIQTYVEVILVPANTHF